MTNKRKTSARTIIEAITKIDYSYWHVKKMYEVLNRRTIIEIAIDRSTGYETSIYKAILSDIENIIANKKVLGADYSEDEKTLNHLKEICKSI